MHINMVLRLSKLGFVFWVLAQIIFKQAIPVNKVNRKAIIMFSAINSVGIGIMVVFWNVFIIIMKKHRKCGALWSKCGELLGSARKHGALSECAANFFCRFWIFWSVCQKTVRRFWFFELQIILSLKTVTINPWRRRQNFWCVVKSLNL